MKNILLSTSLLLAMALSGCNDDTSNDSLSTSSIDRFVKQAVTLNISEGTTSVADMTTTDTLSYEIIGGSDANFFRLDGEKLSFKNAQRYVEGGDNRYYVEVSARDTTGVKNGQILQITVNIIQSGTIVVTKDTSPPLFTTPSAFSLEMGKTMMVTASDASMPITYTLITAGGFTLSSAGLLQAPDTASPSGEPSSITISATDSATPAHTTTKTFIVTIQQASTSGVEFSTIENNRFTWEQANTGCSTMSPAGAWRLPTITEYRANSEKLREDNYSTVPGAFTSVLWASTPATEADKMMGWGYFQNPNDDTAQPKTEPYYYTCIKK